MSRDSGTTTYPLVSRGNGIRVRGGILAGILAVLLLSVASAGPAQAQIETVLHSFAGPPSDGASPLAGLIMDSAGNLYGTTELGGSNVCQISNSGCGTVFKIDSTGIESLLHSFSGGTSDGALPFAGLIMDSAGNLYGTTEFGGAPTAPAGGFGIVYKIDSTGAESVLHSFAGFPNDGRAPLAGLIMDSAGNLYGTTIGGGSYGFLAGGFGTVFKIDSTGVESLLHSFSSPGLGPDGDAPGAGLIMDAAGNLYGTTVAGGSYGAGTVFKIDSSGNESVLYSFAGPPNDGGAPQAGLIMDAAGSLYGTTSLGGAYGAQYGGFGTVFKIDSSGNESVLHSFGKTRSDGADPRAGLIMDSAGNLYGTTQNGGVHHGAGTVFKIDSAGHEIVLYSFGRSTSDGAYPAAGLIMDSAGNLYGTTTGGGSSGNGTVFEISHRVPVHP